MGPATTICVLAFDDYPRLARQVLDSIERNCPRADYRLIVGANAVGQETLQLLQTRQRLGKIDQLVLSPVNLSKCPMMRKMFALVETEFIWWFDDDSYITEASALSTWLQTATADPGSIVQWGAPAWCDFPAQFTNVNDPLAFVRSASWYRGLPPPSWRPGGKGEFSLHDLGLGDGRWLFILGGCFMIRTAAVRHLDWPDPRLGRLGDDVFLGEAIRQQGWKLGALGSPGVALNTESRRGPEA